jgi:Putative zinc-finger
MKIIKHELAEAQVNGACTNPVIREHLSFYITNPLEDPSAEEVEDHLLDCRHCREVFLIMLSVRNEARVSRDKHNGENGRAAHDVKVLQLADFRKEWP